MKAYIDTWAFMKVLINESETSALDEFLDAQVDDFRLLSSVLPETEVRRAATAIGIAQHTATSARCGVNLAAAPHSLFEASGLLPGDGLRSFDALHLSTALRHSADLLIAHDQRLLVAATTHG